jgi:anaerobic magnesium-protoporphyrin IX monomethyl ester cyclase
MTDLLLIHPPQWSPFQPPLSIPSLTAWLKQEGFNVRGRDLNLSFYEWLLSDDCARLMIRKLASSGFNECQRSGFKAIFENARDYRQDIQSLKSCCSSKQAFRPDEIVRHHYITTKSLESYLSVISQLYVEFSIYPYDFRLTGGNLNVDILEKMVITPPDIFKVFINKAIQNYMRMFKPKIIGISCLGQEQLYFTILLGSIIKKKWNLPVIVGGTFFSRIFERGSLRIQWFDKYFDIVVRNEGEISCQMLLSNNASGRPLEKDVTGIVYRKGKKIVATPLSKPLKSENVPIPFFDDMPLDRYFSAQLTIPILASRGCYWGQCEFCRHGMVYGGNYEAYQVKKVLDSIKTLASKYKVSQFCFHDESIPPKILKEMGRLFPPNSESGWTFSGDIRFEKYIKNSDFKNLFNIGFRNFYVGLESASERVLKLMKKHAHRSVRTMVCNLTDAKDAGIWMHCFLFFGFPGETETDAQETFEFILSNADRIGCFGCGTYVLEHNSPLYSHLRDFGVKILPGKSSSLDVFHEYEVSSGLTPDNALAWMKRLAEASNEIPKYYAVCWIPREQYICMLSKISPQQLILHGLAIRKFGGLPKKSTLSQFMSIVPDRSNPDSVICINRLNGRVAKVSGSTAKLIQLFHGKCYDLSKIMKLYPMLMDWISVVYESERNTVRNWLR